MTEREGMEKREPYVSLGIVMVVRRLIFLAGVIGSILMSSMDSLVLLARLFWMALRWALVLIANPSVLKCSCEFVVWEVCFKNVSHVQRGCIGYGFVEVDDLAG
jgi:hypothetical protein